MGRDGEEGVEGAKKGGGRREEERVVEGGRGEYEKDGDRK